MDNGIRATSVQELFVGGFPVGVLDLELDFGDWDDLFEGKTGRIPEIDGEIIGTGSQKVLILQILQIQNGAFVSIDFI